MYRIISILTLILSICTAARADVVAVWSTGVAVPGEKVVLYLIDTEVGQDTFTLAKHPRIAQAMIQVQQPVVNANPLDPNRAVFEVLPIIIRPDKPGALQPEDLVLKYRSGRQVTLRVPPLPVHSTSEIEWYNTPLRYGVLWYTPTNDVYVHQPIKVALKLFLPEGYVSGNLPQLHAVGVKVSNMQPSVQGVIALIHRQLIATPTAFAKQKTWYTEDYTGEFIPFREGNSDITGSIVLLRNNSIVILGQDEVPLPSLTVSALPLPPGAPPQFSDMVGQYSITATTTATALAMNESVEVEITVRGTGNLQQATCPTLSDADDWKAVPPTRKPIVGPDGETKAMVFSQIIRPLTEVRGIPSYTMSYFDPEAMTYKQTSTAPIPLPWRESDASSPGVQMHTDTPPPAGSVPVAEMTDIYDYLPVDSAAYYRLPRALWYLLYVPALAILGFVLAQFLRRRAALHADARMRERALADIAREDDGLAFLKKLGAFIETHIPPRCHSYELQQILQKRDDEAFRPEAAPVVPAAQRIGMLRTVRKALAALAGKAALLLLALAVAGAHAEDAAANAEQHYRARQYTMAQDALQQLIANTEHPSPLLYYNLGNCYYRLGKPGYAALCYARALHIHPGFAEARANLAFVQRKEGAILPVRSAADSVFTLLTCSQLWVATLLCTAALALCIALTVMLRRCPHKPWLHAGSALFAVLSLLCAVDWVYYATRSSPDLSSLPPSDIAYVLQNTAARTAADSQASSVVQLPAGTPVHLLALRGSHAYVETTTGVRGWVTAADVEALTPGHTPRIPTIIGFD